MHARVALGILLSLALFFVEPPSSAQAQGGRLDSRFGLQGKYRLDQPPNDEGGQDLAIDSQGRIYVASRWRDPGFPDPTWWPALLRLTADGTPDPSFGVNGVWGGDLWPAVDFAVRVAVDDQDRPLVAWTIDADPTAATDQAWIVRRLQVSGATDTETQIQFSSGNSLFERIRDLLILPDGRVVATGSVDFASPDHDFAIAVLTDDGAGGLELDSSFSLDGITAVPFDLPNGTLEDRAEAARAQGSSLYVAGRAAGEAGGSRVAVARLDLVTGALDPNFGNGGKATFAYTPFLGTPWERHHIDDIALRPAGGLILAGWGAETSSSWTRLMALAIDAGGSEVLTWGNLGWFVPELHYPGTLGTTFGGAYGVAIDASGGALLVGDIGDPVDNDEARALAIRLSASGQPDSGFSVDGFETYALESGGGPYLDGFAPVLLTDGGKLALTAGWMYGATGGVQRSDVDVAVARIIVDPRLFEDGFESGDTSAWLP